MVFSTMPQLDFLKVKAAYDIGLFKANSQGTLITFTKINQVREVLNVCEKLSKTQIETILELEKGLLEMKRMVMDIEENVRTRKELIFHEYL